MWGRGERERVLPFYQEMMVVGEKEVCLFLELPGDDGSRREREMMDAYSLDLEVSSLYLFHPVPMSLLFGPLFGFSCTWLCGIAEAVLFR